MMKKNNHRGIVLITRPIEAAQEFAKDVQSIGFESWVEPLLEISPQEFVIPALKNFQALIFTSAYAVRVFATVLGPENLPEMPVYVVGPNTREAALAAGFQDIVVARGDGRALADLLIELLRNTGVSLLHPRGEHSAFPLADVLGEAGIKIDEIVVYSARHRTEFSSQLIDLIQKRKIYAATFFSKRTAEGFLTLIKKHDLTSHLKSIKLLCISKPVLECVQSYNWADAYIAKTPDRVGMVELLSKSDTRE